MRTAFLQAILYLALSGCMLGGAYQRPEIPVPDSWSVASSGAGESASFWQDFHSEELTGVVQRALSRNSDLAMALERVEQAREQTRITGASLWPQVSATGGATRDDQKVIDTSRWQGATSLSYELDLFGRNRSETSAARARAEASDHDSEAMRLVVMTDAGSLYAQLLAFNDRIRIAESNLANAQELLRIIEARRNAGASSGLEVSQQQVAVNDLQSARAALLEQRATTRNALAVLLGDAPQQLELPTASLASLSVPELSLTPPAALVAQGRPDIQSMEAELRAMNADIGAARAAFFPTLRLGTDATWAARFGDPASMAVSLASNALAPIFSGGSLRAQLAETKAREREMAAKYRKTVLVAFQEVEDALATLSSARERAQLSRSSLEHASNAYRIAETRFRVGSIDYPTLLETQRSLAQAQDGLVVARLAELESAMQLHKALGEAS
jgi:NodT family efflux transporter outer membrane factor (OMF) lipoprotein